MRACSRPRQPGKQQPRVVSDVHPWSLAPTPTTRSAFDTFIGRPGDRPRVPTLVDRAISGAARALNVPDAWVRAAALALAAVLLGFAAFRAIHLARRSIAARTRTETDDVVLATLAAPAGWTIAFTGIVWAVEILVPTRDVLVGRVLLTGLLVIWGAGAAGLVALALDRSAARAHGIPLAPLLRRLVNIVVAVIILLTILTVWDVSVTPVLASAGIVGIALALAAQDTLANFFAGIAVYLDRPYRIGDWVVLEQGTSEELRGEVQDIGLRSTRILTRDDVLVTVPNSVIASGRVVNESGQVMQYRVRVPVSVAYESDLDRVERILVGVAQDHAKVLGEPEPRARFRSFGDSGIMVELLVWIRDPEHRGIVIHDLMKTVHATFRDTGIRIPFPQRDVHVNPQGSVAAVAADTGSAER